MPILLAGLRNKNEKKDLREERASPMKNGGKRRIGEVVCYEGLA